MSNRRMLGSLITTLICYAAFASDRETVDGSLWIKAQALPGGDGSTYYLNTKFSQKSGSFNAIPESALDDRKSVSGTFLVGTFRFVLDAPEKDMHGIVYDEKITTSIIDCGNSYAGALRIIEKYKGNVVFDESTPDSDIDMIQVVAPTIDDQLCKLQRKQRGV